MKLENKIKVIAEHYGYHKQKDIAIEEMAELTKAICKLQRTSSANQEEYRNALMNVQEEIADVSIMVMQLSHLLIRDDIERIINEKLDRQLQRINEEEQLL